MISLPARRLGEANVRVWRVIMHSVRRIELFDDEIKRNVKMQ